MSALVPPGIPAEILMVTWPNGQRDYLTRELLEGLAAWSKGVDATIVRFKFDAVVHTPPPKKKKTK